MKKITLLFFIVALLLPSYITARTYNGSEKIYLRPIAVSWWLNASAKVGLKFKNSNSSSLVETPWLVDNDGGKIYSVTVPAGDWTHVIVSRHSASPITDLNRWNQTGEIVIPETENYIQSFADNSTTATWQVLKAHYRSKGSGNWSNIGTWIASFDTNWTNSWNYFDAHYVPNNNDLSVVILNNHSVILSQDATISNLSLSSGSTFTASDASPRTLTISKSASGSSTTLTNDGTWANGTGGSTVVFTGAPSSGDAVHAVSGTIAFQNLTVNKTGGSSNVGASFGANSSLTGTLEIGSGGYISTNPPTGFYGTGSILKFNQGALATYDVNALDKTWSTTEIPQNITVASGKVRVNDNRTATGSLIISADATLEVSAAKQLTINTALTNNGTLTLKSANGVGTATLETPSSISGSGTYNVEQYLSDITLPSSFRNWYISSPVSAAVATVITGTTNNILYERNESNNTYPTATSFVAGRGYVAKIAAGNSNVYTFTGGNLNNGEVTVPISRTTSITKEGFNLVGNPFPAHLKWLQTTADTYGVMTTIWYRTYNSGYSFQTYNAQGDMGVPLDASGYIPPMQAFWVRKIAAGSGNLTLNSTNAVHRSGNPLRAPAQKSGVPNKILRLEVQSNANVDEALIYFNANAANNFDGFDSPKWFNLNDTIPEIYTVADAEKLVINGLNSIQLDTEIPLGFRTGNTNGNHNFKLKATQLQNFGTETELVLIDKGITPTETVLNEGTEYTFNSLAVNSTDRFSLVFRAKGSTTGGCCFGTFENKVRIQKNDNNQLVVNCDNNALKNANLTLYNAAGQKLIEQSITESRTTINLALKTGVYLVKLQTEGKIYNVKVAI